MMKIFKVFLIIFCLILGVGFSNMNSSIKIIKYEYYPSFTKVGRTVCIPSGEQFVSIKVYTKNATKIKFYLIPTGTDTFVDRKLIGEQTSINDVFEITHKFNKDEDILHHLYIELSNGEEMTHDIVFKLQRCN